MRTPLRHTIALTAASTLALTALAASAAGAPKAPTDNIHDGSEWTENAFESIDPPNPLTPQQDDVAGPARPTFGPGSHQITIGSSTVQAEIYRTDAYDGVLVSDLTRLEFSTYAHANAGSGLRQPSSLRLAVDVDGDDTADQRIYFYPANNADQQPVANDVWQTWRATQTTGNFNVDGDQGPPPNSVTLAQYVALFPTATIVSEDVAGGTSGGGLGLLTGGSQGGPGDPQINGVYNVDRVIVGVDGADVLYDLGTLAEADGGTTDVVVNPDDLHGWERQAFDFNNANNPLTPNSTFVSGPGTPPAGVGSLQFTLSDDTNPGRVERLRTDAYDGRLVRDIRTLDYSTYQVGTGPTPQQPVYIRLNIDTDANGSADEVLYYYPANNAETDQPIAQSTWQTWHAADGNWNVGGDTGPANSVTLAEYVVTHPDAEIVANPLAPGAGGGGFAFQVGGGGAAQLNGTFNLDAVTIATVDEATAATVTGTSADLEPLYPAMSVANASVTEGNSGSPKLSFPVTLDAPADHVVTVHYATSNGTAASGDYTSASGTATIAAGATSTTIKVSVKPDTKNEPDETVTLTLSDPVGATLGDATATGTIKNDDTAVTLKASSPKKGKVKVNVTTKPGKKASVNVFVNGKSAFKGNLNGSGKLSKTLPKKYKSKKTVKVYAQVKTDAGKYKSKTVKVKVK